MPRLTDPTELRLLKEALSKRIKWCERPKEELWRDCAGVWQKDVNEQLREHATQDHEINRVEENEPALREMGKTCFYEFRIKVCDTELYVKTRVMDGPELYVVSLHKGWTRDGKVNRTNTVP